MRSQGRNPNRNDHALYLLFFSVLLLALSSPAVAQKKRAFSGDGGVLTKRPAEARTALGPEDAPPPSGSQVFSGELTCKGLANTQVPPGVEVTGRELKLAFGGTYSDTFEFRDYSTSYGVVDLIGSIQTTPPGTIQVSAGPNVLNSFVSEKPIKAVIIKVDTVSSGTKSYVYYYNVPGKGFTLEGSNLAAGSPPDSIGHISFCFAEAFGPSAAEVTVSGRVVEASGRGIYGAYVTITDTSTGNSISTKTSPFGYYTFEGLEAGRFYFISVSSKRYKFADSVKTFTLNDNISDVDFVANP